MRSSGAACHRIPWPGWSCTKRKKIFVSSNGRGCASLLTNMLGWLVRHQEVQQVAEMP